MNKMDHLETSWFTHAWIIIQVYSVIKRTVFVFLSSVLPSLTDRLGDAKDQVRDQAQALLLKIMDQAANPQVCTPLQVNLSALLHKHRSRWHYNLYEPLFLSMKFTDILSLMPNVNLQYVWDRMLGGFKHKNNRTREAVCLCLISTLNMCVLLIVLSVLILSVH